jgi:molecular chaperone Hsp33
MEYWPTSQNRIAVAQNRSTISGMDGLVRALLPGDLRVSVVNVTNSCRLAIERHGLSGSAAALLSQGIAGGVLLASLQKGHNRINFQLECDGPLRGFLVDASASGEVRGYVKNPNASVELGSGDFRWRAVLGNSGFISVLRDIGEEYYRSSVELIHLDVAKDLMNYFVVSDQIPTVVALETLRGADGMPTCVVGVLVQVMPDGDVEVLNALGVSLGTRLSAVASKHATAAALFEDLFPGAPLLVEPTEVKFACSCSKARALQTLTSLGAREVQDIVDTMGSTAVTCHFCGLKHEITLPDLLKILDELGHPVAQG